MGGPPSSPEFGCAGCTGRAGAPELLRRQGRVVAVSPGDCVTPAVLWGKVNLSRAPPFAGLAARGLGRVLPGPWEQKARWWSVHYCGTKLQDVARWLWVTGPHSKQGTIHAGFVRCGFYACFIPACFLACMSWSAHMNYL